MTFDVNTHPFMSKVRNLKSAGLNKWSASCNCSGHKNGDKNRSLSIAYDPSSEKLLVYCFLNHTAEEIVSAYGCSMSDLFTGNKDSNVFMKAVHWYANKNRYRLGDIYKYSYPPFNDDLYKIRFYDSDGEKTFAWVHKDNANRFGYTWGRKGLPNRLYVAGNLSDDTIIVTEGEKDANTVHLLTGLTAVSAENGATLGSADKKWMKEYNTQLTGKDVYILFDNDSAGLIFAEIEKNNLLSVAKTVHMLDICSVWADCPEKADITDFVAEKGEDEAKQAIKKLMSESVPIDAAEITNTIETPPEQQSEQESEETLPEWIMETEYHGHVTRKINEPLFCEMFQKENTVARINGVFYINGEQVSDDLILSMIQKKISPFFLERTGRKTADLFISLQNNSFVRQPEPDERKIYCGKDLTIAIDDNGILSFAHENVFTLSRLAVDYNPMLECPTFLKYLNDLLYEEDIPTVQEYIGYCMIPSTRAQAGLFIHGQGGEGKSVLRDIMMKMFNHGAVQEGIHQLSERFVLANLENKLCCIDDDMRSDKLSDTAIIKRLITNSPTSPIQVERKNKQKYDSFVYARIFAIGNTFIGSKFDHSDGFYRRQLLIDCKPKTRPESLDDRRISDKCIAEIGGIFNWAIAGLIRLVQNGYHFTVSDRMKQTLDDVKHEGNNALTFFEDESVIKLTEDWTSQISSVDLFTAYALWCFDTGETPIKRRSFLNTTNERFKIYKVRFFEGTTRRQGFNHLKLSDEMGKRIAYLDEKTANRIERLP